jgi:hypothetical protein
MKYFVLHFASNSAKNGMTEAQRKAVHILNIEDSQIS